MRLELSQRRLSELSYDFRNLNPETVSKIVETISSISEFGGTAESTGSTAVWRLNGARVVLDWSNEKIRLTFDADQQDLYGKPRLQKILVQAIGSVYLT